MPKTQDPTPGLSAKIAELGEVIFATLGTVGTTLARIQSEHDARLKRVRMERERGATQASGRIRFPGEDSEGAEASGS